MSSVRAIVVLLTASVAGCATSPENGVPISRCEASGSFKNELHGGGGNDQIFAGDAAQIFGDEDRDLIVGQGDDDELNGGPDADIMLGGPGADRFVYETASDSAADSNGDWSPQIGDTIVDFKPAAGDRLVLTRLAPPTGLQWTDQKDGAYSVWARSNDADTILFVEMTGDRTADVAIRMLGQMRLSKDAVCI